MKVDCLELGQICLRYCILLGPSGEHKLYIVPGETELRTRLRRGVGQAAHTLNNPQVGCTGVLLYISKE